jgi:exopolysaccharide biosynthesis polyprenyl glycosylphosphotransferase
LTAPTKTRSTAEGALRHAQSDPASAARSAAPRAVPADRPLPAAARWERKFVLSLFVLDVILVSTAVIAGLHFRFDKVHLAPLANSAAALVLIPAWLGLLAVSRAYERERLNVAAAQFRAIFEASVRMAALVAFLVYLTRTTVSRGFFLVALPGGFVALILGRAAARAVLHRARRRGHCLHRVLAVGTPSDVEHLIAELGRRDRHGLRVVGACVGSGDRVELACGVPVVGTPAGARRAAADVGADTVAVTSTSVLGREGLRHLAWQLEGSDTDLLLTPELTDVAGPRVHVRPVGALSLLQVSEPKFSGASRLFKAAFDRLLSAVLLLALTPLFAVVAVCIRIDSRGPVFFRQVRSGMGGKPFRVVKFRSMVPTAEDLLIDLTDANEGSGMLFKIHKDPRVTRVGKILRRTSLDELPQLWNVVRGQMSLVGPRPPLPTEVEQYGDDVRRRLLVKPGLTGLWQVSGRSDLSWEESVRLDLYYVENWSFLLDLTILARTVGAVAAGRGAY